MGAIKGLLTGVISLKLRSLVIKKQSIIRCIFRYNYALIFVAKKIQEMSSSWFISIVKSIDQFCVLLEYNMSFHFQSWSQFATRYRKIFAQYPPFLNFFRIWFRIIVGKINSFLNCFSNKFISRFKDVINCLEKRYIFWTTKLFSARVRNNNICSPEPWSSKGWKMKIRHWWFFFSKAK